MTGHTKSTESRFSSVARLIHWISAALIIILLGSGFRAGFVTDPEVKAAVLRVHLPVAIIVLLLTVLRLVWWWRFDVKPGPVAGVPAWQHRIAHWTHRTLYAVVFLLLASGIAMSIMSGLPDALFGSTPFPKLSELPPRAGHGIGARLLLGLVVLHAGAALYHHLFLKDQTLKRMWFTKN